MSEEGKVRLDKWLWAARFFKTRQLAHEALELGRINVNGDRVKASRNVQVGDVLDMRIQQLEYRLTVLALSTQRRPAKEAQLLYSEDEDVRTKRDEQRLVKQAERVSFPFGDGKPTKKGRRDIQKFKTKFGNE